MAGRIVSPAPLPRHRTHLSGTPLAPSNPRKQTEMLETKLDFCKGNDCKKMMNIYFFSDLGTLPDLQEPLGTPSAPLNQKILIFYALITVSV